MMRNRFLSLLALFVVGIFVSLMVVGCSEDEVLAPEDFAPPTNLKALSRDGSVTLYWTASPSSGSSSFAGYRILVVNTSSSTLVDSAQVGPSITNYTASSLVNGQSYTFTVRSVKDNGDVSQSVVLEWGPTIRFTNVVIYEFDSPSNPSGLQFSTGSALSFSSSGPDNRGLIDLWIDGRSNSTPLLKSPTDQSISTGWRTTMFVETAATGLDQQVDVPPIGSFRSTPGLTITPGKVYFAKTQDNHYVRFTVGAVQGTAPNRNVSVTFQYNSGSGVWAK
jgi:hypothetical protein